jgi:hypothetical protein
MLYSDLAGRVICSERPTVSYSVVSAEGSSPGHVIVLNERHLKRLMNEYVRYYHEDRTHLALAKETPASRETVSNSGVNSKVIAMPRLGGLHHRYDPAA